MTIQDTPTTKHRRRRRRRHGANGGLAPCLHGVLTDGRGGRGWVAGRAFGIEGQEGDEADSVTRGVQLLARAYGYGRSFERTEGRWVVAGAPWEPTDARTGAGDEANPAAVPGLTVARQAEPLLQARRAINPKDAEQVRLLKRGSPEKVAAAERWSKDTSLRAGPPRSAYRTGEFEAWQRAKGVAFVPVNPSATKTLRALSRAELSGPLEALLLFAATLDLSHWAKVQPFLLACGHPEYACNQVAAEFYGLNATIADGAKAAGVRASTYAEQVRRAKARVDEWLERASPRIVENTHEEGVLVAGSIFLVDGEVKLLDRGTRPPRSRDPATFNCDELSGLMAERWWRPGRLGLDRFGRGEDRGQRWEGRDAVDRCNGLPGQSRLLRPMAEDERRHRVMVAATAPRDADEADGWVDVEEVQELRFID